MINALLGTTTSYQRCLGNVVPSSIVSILTGMLILPDHVAHLIRVRFFVVGLGRQHIGDYNTASLSFQPGELTVSPSRTWQMVLNMCHTQLYPQCLLTMSAGLFSPGICLNMNTPDTITLQTQWKERALWRLCNFVWGCVALLTTDLLSPKM